MSQNIQDMSQVNIHTMIEQIIDAGPPDVTIAHRDDMTEHLKNLAREIEDSQTTEPFAWVVHDMNQQHWIYIYDQDNFLLCATQDLAHWRKVWREKGFQTAWLECKAHYSAQNYTFQTTIAHAQKIHNLFCAEVDRRYPRPKGPSPAEQYIADEENETAYPTKSE